VLLRDNYNKSIEERTRFSIHNFFISLSYKCSFVVVYIKKFNIYFLCIK